MTDKKTWFITGADSIGLPEQEVADLEEQIDAYRDQSTPLALNDLQQLAGNRR
jgi:hypothetical protein